MLGSLVEPATPPLEVQKFLGHILGDVWRREDQNLGELIPVLRKGVQRPRLGILEWAPVHREFVVEGSGKQVRL